jgi:hypothetical protein
VRLLLLPGLIGYGALFTALGGEGVPRCIWRLLFGFKCPGCGLSRANALLVNGSIHEAVAMNWLVVPLWLVAIHSFVIALPTLIQEAHHG